MDVINRNLRDRFLSFDVDPSLLVMHLVAQRTYPKCKGSLWFWGHLLFASCICSCVFSLLFITQSDINGC